MSRSNGMTDPAVVNHPIFRSIEESLKALKVYEASVEDCDEDGGAAMKAALTDVMAKLQAVDETVKTHPDGQLPVPVELLEENADWDAIRIQELEAALAEDDKQRNRKRHLNDLAQLLTAALGKKT
mmetsp:Transcript_28554/g.91928  ORF Transcript_28554/g.91928 Transcript_28554/m.91928 type:complete len:126 (+) Transcript_28554:105-482(+)